MVSCKIQRSGLKLLGDLGCCPSIGMPKSLTQWPEPPSTVSIHASQLHMIEFPWERVNGPRCPLVASVRFDEYAQTNIWHPVASAPAAAARAIGADFRDAYCHNRPDVYMYYPSDYKKGACLAQAMDRWCKGLCSKKRCWANSFRRHLKGVAGENGHPKGIMLQVIEKGCELGPGQQEEVAMAQDLKVPIYLCMVLGHDTDELEHYMFWEGDDPRRAEQSRKGVDDAVVRHRVTELRIHYFSGESVDTFKGSDIPATGAALKSRISDAMPPGHFSLVLPSSHPLGDHDLFEKVYDENDANVLDIHAVRLAQPSQGLDSFFTKMRSAPDVIYRPNGTPAGPPAFVQKHEQLLLFAEWDQHVVKAYNIDTRQIICTYGSPGTGEGQFMNPYQVVVTPNDLHVLVSEPERVHVLQMWVSSGGSRATLQHVRFIGPKRGRGRMLDNRGVALKMIGERLHVWVLDQMIGGIAEFDLQGNFIRDFELGFDGLHTIAFLPSGNCVAAATLTKGIYEIDQDGGVVGLLGNSSSIPGMFVSVVADEFGNLIVLNSNDNCVHLFSAEGQHACTRSDLQGVSGTVSDKVRFGAFWKAAAWDGRGQGRFVVVDSSSGSVSVWSNVEP